MKQWVLILAIAGMFGIAACGGGGGGGGNAASGVDYVGITAPVVLTTVNYADVSNTFIENKSPSDFLVGTLSSPASVKFATRLTAKMASSVRTAIRRNVSPRASDSMPGNISGSISYSGTEPVLGSHYVYTMRLINFADTDMTGGATVNGVVSVSGIESITNTNYALDDTYIYSNFSVLFPGPPVFNIECSGDARCRVVGSNASGVSGYVNYTNVSDRFTYGAMIYKINDTYLKVEDYDVFIDWTNAGRISINGNAYYSDYGLVVVETISPIGFGSGTVHLHGTDGTSVKLEFGWGTCTGSLESGDDAPPAFDDGTVELTL